MSKYDYFDDLSGDDSSHGSRNSDSDSDSGGDGRITNLDRTGNSKETADIGISTPETKTGTRRRVILHADVDCFYCQCEMMDRNLDAERPLAIGQKHIIVTCNYAARAMGITKLMDRKKAQEMGGAALLIVDGSDLQRYRIYARKIYESFRKSIKSVDAKSRVRKGCMDEMIADISTVPFWNSCSADTFMNHLHDIFIYDDVSYGASDAVTLTEDQSGAQTTFTRRAYSESLRSIPSKSDHGVEEFHTQLRQAAVFAMQIRQSMLDKTGFTVTMGISYNSMMAKIASGIKKPGRVNVLLPCVAAQQLIHAMPLRKIHGIGSRTMKALKPCLEQRHGRKCDNDSPWTCRDLLSVPPNDIIQCLRSLQNASMSSSTYQCDEILDLCNGIDDTSVTDDDGTLQKSLSVENSLRNGTIRSKAQVLQIMEDLYRRLILLLHDRKEWSEYPSLAYPMVIRVTARSSFDLVGKGRRDRSFTTRSQQSKFEGGRTICNDGLSTSDAVWVLRQSVTPLLHSLLFTSQAINVTRLNLCVTNFQDIGNRSSNAMAGTLNSFIVPRLDK